MVALHEARPVLERNPDRQLVDKVLEHFRLGNRLFDAADYAGALREYESARSLVGEDPVIANNIGVSLASLGRLEEALESYDQAIATAPRDSVALHNRGVALAQLRRFEDAVAAYDQALNYAPEDAGTLANRGLALAHLGRHKQALVSIDKALDLKRRDEGLIASRHQIVADLLKRLADQGVVSWSGGMPQGSQPRIPITKGPPVSDYVIEDRG